MKEFEETYILKGVGIPSYYLGVDIVEVSSVDTWKMEPIDWMMSSKTYSTNMIKKFEELMSEGRPQYAFPEYKTPMDVEYHPELDESALVDAEMHTRYRSMIGSQNRLIAIGRFDIQFSTTLMAMILEQDTSRQLLELWVMSRSLIRRNSSSILVYHHMNSIL